MVRIEQTCISEAMNTKVIGTGETTLVLAHGYGATQSVWDEVIPNLGRNYRLVLFDWCFSGSIDESKKKKMTSFDETRHPSYEGFADDLIALADEVDIRGAVYLGHSMSGMVGCIASVKRPDIFHHLLLLGASPRYLNSEDFRGGFDMEEVENLFWNIESNFDQWSTNFPKLVVDPNDPTSTAKFTSMLQSMRPGLALSVAKTVFLTDQRHVLDKVDLPCTIIQCSNDVVVPMPVAEYMYQKLKETQLEKSKMERENDGNRRRTSTSLEIIEADGHFPQLTCPRALVEVIDGVLLLPRFDGLLDSNQPQTTAVEPTSSSVEPVMEASYHEK